MADALKARCVLADVRWRWTLRRCYRWLRGLREIFARIPRSVTSLSGTKPYFFSSLRINLSAAPFVPPGLDQHIKDFALGIHGTPEVDQATIDLEIDFVEMPDGMRFRPAFAKIGRDLGSKIVHPVPDGLVAAR
jgi:hypothetical protein